MENWKKYESPVTLKRAEVPMLSLVGSGTYFGLIFVFLRSLATIDVPLGTMTPPYTEFNL